MMNGHVPNKRTCLKKSMKIQNKNQISWILPKIQVKIKDFEEEKMVSWIFNSISLSKFYTGFLFGALSSII